MKKILTAPQIRAADAYTIAHEPISSLNLMERASRAFTNWFTTNFSRIHPVKVVCGTGNNGGDGMAIARLLADHGYKVLPMVVGDVDKGSEDFKANFNRYRAEADVLYLGEGIPLPTISTQDVLIDALFGSGLSRPLVGYHARLIRYLNNGP